MRARMRARLAVAAGALAVGLLAPALAGAHGDAADEAAAAASRELREGWPAAWAFPPLELLPVALGVVLYAVRARRLGPRLPAWRAACFMAGVAVLVLAITSPLHPIGEEGLFWVHMLQHVLLGDIAALLVVLGVTGPILRPALALGWVQRLRFLAHPLVALPLWTVNLALWHVPAVYEGAIANAPIHALEHIAFFSFGAMMWAAIIEPLPGPAWFGTGPKILYVAGVRVAETVLGNILWFSGTVLYPSYALTAPEWGLTPLEDQVNAGTVMMVITGLLTLLTLLFLFLRLAREGEQRQALVEAGVDAAAARRAVRYGRGDALAARHGLVPSGVPGEARLVPMAEKALLAEPGLRRPAGSSGRGGAA